MARMRASIRRSGQPSASVLSMARSIGDLILDHAGDDGAEQGDFGRLVLLALDFLADPPGLEFVEDFAQALAVTSI